MIKIFLIDDHMMFREGLCAQFAKTKDLRVVAQAANRKEAIAQIEKVKCDVAVVDIKLEDSSGLELIKTLKAGIQGVRVLMLSMYDHERYVQQALDNGAVGYVLKGSKFDDLLEAVRTVNGGKQYLAPELAKFRKEREKCGEKAPAITSLSEREFEVFSQIARGKLIKEIAGELGVSENSVSTYRARIMEKLGVDSKADLVKIALESGIIE